MALPRGGLNLLHADGVGPEPKPLTPGAPVQAVLTFYPTDFALEQDARLRLTLRAHDPTDWYTTDPHGATLGMHLGAETMLSIPVAAVDEDRFWKTSCGELLSSWADCFDARLADIR